MLRLNNHQQERVTKGTILDFLNLAAEKQELAHDLLELAAKHDFEFTVEELSDDELDSVSGGLVSTAVGESPLMAEMTSQNLQFLALQQNIQMESRRYQTISNAITASHQSASNSISNMK